MNKETTIIPCSEQHINNIYMNMAFSGLFSIILAWIFSGMSAKVIDQKLGFLIFGVLFLTESVLLQILIYKKEIKKNIRNIGIVVGSIIIIGGILHRFFANGFVVFINSVIATWNEKNGTIYYLFITSDQNITFDFLIFSVLTMSIIVALLNLAIRLESLESVLGITYVALLAYIILGKVNVIFIILATIIMLIYMVLDNCGREVYRHSLVFWLFFGSELAMVSIGMLLFCSMISNQGMERIQNKFIQQIESVFYGKPDLTDGDLQYVDSRKTGTQQRLIINTSSNNVIYLKGFVGSNYDDNQWKNLEDEVYIENKDMLQWLLDNNMASATFLGSFLVMEQGYNPNTIQVEETTITIENVSASSKYMYMPYTIANLRFEYNANFDRDINVKNGIVQLNDKYTVTFEDVHSEEFVDLYNNGCLTDSEIITNWEAYFNSEQSYRDFVQENYMDLPTDIEMYFDKKLNRIDQPVAADVTKEIREYLASEIRYADSPIQRRGGDFVLATLNETQEGYSVHYATIATLMFRYYGIPARYVEGYRVTPNSSKTVTVNDAHAWVEIYRYGMGWVPIEVTPGYYEEKEYSGVNSGASSVSEVPITSMPNIISEEDSTTSEEQVAKKLSWNEWIIIVVFLLLLLLAVILLRRFLIQKKRKERIQNDVAADAVLFMAGIMWKIAKNDNVLVNTCIPSLSCNEMNQKYLTTARMDFSRICDILMKAKYSNLNIESEEFFVIHSYMEMMSHSLYDNANFFRRLVLRYLKVLC